MNRVIKFRAWHKSSEQYTYDIQKTEKNYHDFDTFLSDKDYIIEQYTGLKDKNGVEIYEGDRIRLHKDYTVISNKIMQEGTIRWCDNGYWCVASDYSINDYNRNNKPLSNFPLNSYEVISNIHTEEIK